MSVMQLIALLLASTLMEQAQAAATTLYQFGRAPPAQVGGDLHLTDMNGQPFQLSRLNRPALIFFGFTGCGDTCPTAMLSARLLLQRFKPDERAPAILFVTLDPYGDTPKRLKAYLANFDPRIVGLTGSPAAIGNATDKYGVGVNTASGSIAHSSVWYLLNEDSQVERVYEFRTAPQDLEVDLRAALRKPHQLGWLRK